ncbi:MAG: hypothetical protein R3B57_04065 [Phycisphaerales bacterium]
MRRAPLASVRAAVASLALAAPILSAQAQIQDVAPRWVVVTQKDAPARCDDFDRFYKVATFQPGQILRLDGESEEWARIVYPATLHALVPASDAKGVGAGIIQLATDSRLRAPSAVLGIAGSWHSLYAQALPAGTRLQVMGEELGTNGEVIAYRVKAPTPPAVTEAPHAFIKLAALRDATPAEINAHTQPDNPASESEADVTPIEATPSATTKPSPSGGQGVEKPSYSTELLEPMVRPGQEKVQKNNQAKQAPKLEQAMPWTPAQDADDLGQNNDEDFDIVAPVTPREERAPGSNDSPESTPSATPEQVEKPVPAPKPASVETLEASLDAARKLDTESLDIALDELLAEYKRTLASEESKRDADDRVVRGLRRASRGWSCGSTPATSAARSTRRCARRPTGTARSPRACASGRPSGRTSSSGASRPAPSTTGSVCP